MWLVTSLEKGTIPAPDTEQGLGIAGGAPGMNAALEWGPSSGSVIIVLSYLDLRRRRAGRAPDLILAPEIMAHLTSVYRSGLLERDTG